MSNYVTVANLAAIKMGTQARVAAPGDDTVLARKLAAVWDIERKAVLREGSFNFSMQRAELAAQVDAVPYPWEFCYPLPTGWLRFIEVLNPGVDATGYQLEAGKILCNVPAPLYVRYVEDVKTEALWDEAFAEAFACRLAWKCGKSITGTTYDEQGGLQEYRLALAAANRVDAMENPRIESDEVGWVMARFGVGGLTGWR